jgi:hypothetical protein
MVKVYKYIGEVEIELVPYGLFQPGEEKKVEGEINHPLFEEVKKNVPKKEDKEDTQEKN